MRELPSNLTPAENLEWVRQNLAASGGNVELAAYEHQQALKAADEALRFRITLAAYNVASLEALQEKMRRGLRPGLVVVYDKNGDMTLASQEAAFQICNQGGKLA